MRCVISKQKHEPAHLPPATCHDFRSVWFGHKGVHLVPIADLVWILDDSRPLHNVLLVDSLNIRVHLPRCRRAACRYRKHVDPYVN